MKKTALILLAFLIFLTASCKKGTNEDILNSTTEVQSDFETTAENTLDATSENTSKINSETNADTTTTTEKQNPPEYVPGSIPLLGNYYYDNQTVSRKYRLLYTMIPGAFLDLVPENDFAEWAEENLAGTTFTTNEMSLVMFVKQFNISRNDFNNAVTKYTEQLEEFGKGANINEENEVPNADVIYTFDNKIINRYYRYE